ncbi:MAG TPA: hypoxanthine phosphoribosyltransferase [Candidatus Magasanikbacteria bacterium]|nr:MAG: hypoxanthine phosphoribosyltransferase [Candidatus Magasanikbacteria bacterium RIFCSPLOWO2_02_FULL_47_16]OGH79709.1 MAG: hypoxanthine phosphoribosyltransferase [Candidatus Magasanikbacteria bacterium RIFCSPHIGHO2_02_FULL_48_18]OGH83024.1 MAG: hypoxanthine phosphoribosyltransferase [Candidatus Magasanikbacteria bacterium RIFCSPLOWO2_12_FULL_47_9b]HAZ29000.1 hypoxanthine phosphoribosyltransferase [Candidatus Magasanikbacteria bacterium]
MATTKKINVLFSAEMIRRRIRPLAYEISQCLDTSQELVLVVILKGAVMFGADLARALAPFFPLLRVEFMRLSSYGNERKTSGEVKVELDLSHPIEGRQVLVVEDIIDTGTTLGYLVRLLQARRPRTLQVAALLDKPSGRHAGNGGVHADYVGFEVGPVFVVGYGLDDAGFYRALPYVGVVED